jgi:prepilin-type N-terminal cleavage/methylation domain-containing protein
MYEAMYPNSPSISPGPRAGSVPAPGPGLTNPRAFTLIEILVVLTIIAILGGILLVAMHGLLGGSKANQTKATLGTLRGMLTEYENATHFQSAPTQWEWAPSNSSPSNTVVEPRYFISLGIAYPTPDFWRNPHYNSSNSTYPQTPDPLVAPPLVVTGAQDRYGSVAVINTQIAMNLLASLPVNQSTLQSMSTHVMDTMQWTGGNTTISGGGLTNGSSSPYVPIPNLPPSFAFGVCWNSSLGGSLGVSGGTATQNTSQTVGYVVGVQVKYVLPGSTTPPTYWTWINVGSGSSPPGNETPTAPDTNWTRTSTAPVPLFLDAWGNPIIFVPASGLLVRSASQTDATGKQMPILIQSPDHKPFFASAGPDGDFSSGDDNVYSFEE